MKNTDRDAILDNPPDQQPGPCAYEPSCRSPLGGWPGGKFLLAKRIVARLAPHHCYCEPFCGAAWLLFRKSPSRVECINDRDDDVFHFFETIRLYKDELLERGRWLLYSRAQQQAFLNEPLPDWDKDPVERAFRFLYLRKSSVTGWYSKWDRKKIIFRSASKNSPNIYKSAFIELIESAHRRLEKVYLENRDWRDCLDIYDRPHTLFYLDPPYPGTSWDYGRAWPWSEYEELAERLRKLKGRFLLSINDREECRQLFRGFYLEEVRTNYGLLKGSKRVHELLIGNYPWPGAGNSALPAIFYKE